MKISDRTIEILKNFANINNNISIKAGNALSSEPQNKSGGEGKIYAFATVEDTFEKDFALYDISGFLTIISSLGKDTDLDFSIDNKIVFKAGKSKVNYTLGNPAFLLPPRKYVPKEEKVSLVLNKDEMSKVTKLSSIISATRFYIRLEEKVLKIICTDDDSVSFNDFVLELPDTKLDDMDDFQVAVDISFLYMLLNDDYTIKLFDNYLTMTTSKEDVIYAIPYALNTKKGF